MLFNKQPKIIIQSKHQNKAKNSGLQKGEEIDNCEPTQIRLTEQNSKPPK